MELIQNKKAQAGAIILVTLAVIVLAVLFVFYLSKNFDRDASNEVIGETEEPSNFGEIIGLSHQTDDCFNDDRIDTDGDGVSDVCDNCPAVYNPEQSDIDNDSVGDVCEYKKKKSKSSSQDDEGECDSDADCGTDGFVGASYCLGTNVARNYVSFTCVDAGEEDSRCTSQTIQKITEHCQLGCDEGACLAPQISCDNDSDCDDSNSLTFDVCANPGTENSYCQHTSIACAANSDCGSDVIGEQYCLDSDIYRSITQFYCINPGMLNAACSPDILQQFVSSCQHGCSGGSCIIPPTCTNECVFGERQCVGNGWRLCAYFDSDPCTEWSILTNCGPYKTCNGGFCL